MTEAPAPRRPFPSGAAAAAFLALVAVSTAPRTAGAADDLEPTPPLLFFPTPDAEAKKQIEEIISTSFGDVSKAAAARDVLVRRFGLWSVPALVARIEVASNVTESWNAALTLGSLRRAYGPSHLLWPAIRPLTAAVEKQEPYLAAFAALALGEFHGPDSVRRSPASQEGTAEGAKAARQALVAAEATLVRALAHPHPDVPVAAALALAKTGGTSVASRVAEHFRKSPPPGKIPPREAFLLLQGLVPAPDDERFAAALKDGEASIRAAAALSMACWAVAEGMAEAEGLAAGPSATLSRAKTYEGFLDFKHNVALRLAGLDGAEATFARGMLALRTGRMDAWDEIFLVAKSMDTERATAVAATQALVFAPEQSPVRLQMADHAGRNNSFGALRFEPVLAGFLVVAGTDGTPTGVHACREFLRNKARKPVGRLEYDVRYHAAVGLVRALVAGRVDPASRADAAEALIEAARGHLATGPGRPFREVLADLKPALAAGGALPENASTLLESAFTDPDGLLARRPVDVALVRLDAWTRSVFGLKSMEKAATGPPGSRTPSREDAPQRLLDGWLEGAPYFTRTDFRRDRGRLPAPPAAAGVDAAREIDRR